MCLGLLYPFQCVCVWFFVVVIVVFLFTWVAELLWISFRGSHSIVNCKFSVSMGGGDFRTVLCQYFEEKTILFHYYLPPPTTRDLIRDFVCLEIYPQFCSFSFCLNELAIEALCCIFNFMHCILEVKKFFLWYLCWISYFVHALLSEFIELSVFSWIALDLLNIKILNFFS